MHATASSSIRWRSAAGGHRSPKMCSFRFSPVPTPRKNRPGIMASEVAAAWATSPGWILINGQVTPVPRRSRSVAWATPPITLHTNGLSPWASIQGWKWSETSAKENPVSSARWANRTRSLGPNSSDESVYPISNIGSSCVGPKGPSSSPSRARNPQTVSPVCAPSHPDTTLATSAAGPRSSRDAHREHAVSLLDSLGPISEWPVFKQVANRDTKGLGETAFSKRSIELVPRTETAQEVVKSICPYCGVGCGQNVYVSDGKITDIEGDPDSPVSRGRLCPKGAATFQLVTGSHRVHSVLYRKPRGTKWEEIPLDQAMDMVAERVKKARDENWKDADPDGNPLNHTVAMAHLGGATLDNEENYFIKKLFTALGVIQVENQARI